MPGTTRKKTKKKKQPSAKTRSARTSPKRRAKIREATPDMAARIRERAYYIFLKRGGESGEALGDWLQAERELTD